MHVGALAAAATVLPEEQRNMVWGAGAALVLTRVVLLAHWVSDVAVGLAVGTAIERLLRPLTGYGREPIDATIRGSQQSSACQPKPDIADNRISRTPAE